MVDTGSATRARKRSAKSPRSSAGCAWLAVAACGFERTRTGWLAEAASWVVDVDVEVVSLDFAARAVLLLPAVGAAAAVADDMTAVENKQKVLICRRLTVSRRAEKSELSERSVGCDLFFQEVTRWTKGLQGPGLR